MSTPEANTPPFTNDVSAFDGDGSYAPPSAAEEQAALTRNAARQRRFDAQPDSLPASESSQQTAEASQPDPSSPEAA
jgi:hypothetical protein